MRYLLDSNSVIALLNDPASKLAKRARREKPSELGMPSIVTHELFYAAYKSQRTEANIALVDALQFATLEFDREDSRKAGEVRAYLESRGARIGAYDVLIAGQALARGLIMVTHNVREFSRVAGLKVEDWES